MFDYTTAIDKLRRMTKPIRVVPGGTSAGKTEGIIAVLIQECTERKDIDCTVVAESVPALKDGAIKIFKTTMQQTGRWNEDNYNYTDRIYSFGTGSRIQFKAFDTVGKAKAAGKRSHLFINECQYIPWFIVEELMVRTFETVWFDYNPNNPFWVHEEIIPRSDAEVLTLTFEDNEFTPPRVKEDFERRKEKAFHDPDADWQDPENVKNSYYANWCRVYIKGLLGALEGVVFPDYHIIDSIPREARLLGYGMDFGYTNDPTTWIAVYKLNNDLYLKELLYQRGMKSSAIAEFMTTNGNHRMVTYADSADPRLIDEIYDHGVNIRAATKGKDSIAFGIDQVQDHDNIFITSDSLNLIREFREYLWEIDKDGKRTGGCVGPDHAIDAVRYAAIMLLIKRAVTRRTRATVSKFS